MSGATAAAAGARAVADIPDASGSWGDISFSSPTTSGESAAVITFSGGGTRNITPVASPVAGTLEVKVNSGSYGPTAVASSGDTLTFKFTAAGFNESFTATVADASDGDRTVDTFAVTVTGY